MVEQGRHVPEGQQLGPDLSLHEEPNHQYPESPKLIAPPFTIEQELPSLAALLFYAVDAML